MYVQKQTFTILRIHTTDCTERHTCLAYYHKTYSSVFAHNYIASKWNRWDSCCFSTLSSRRSSSCSTPTTTAHTRHVPSKQKPVMYTSLLGVRYSFNVQSSGFSGGWGTTMSCELGMICVQLRLRFFWLSGVGIPTVISSTKFGVCPKPNSVYGNCRAKCADWLNCAAEKTN